MSSHLKPVLRKVSVASIKRAPFNAASRMTDGRLEALREEIRNNDNYIEVPVTLSADFVLIDGHRRYTIALELGIEFLLARVYEAVNSGTAEFNRLFKFMEGFRSAAIDKNKPLKDQISGKTKKRN